MDVRYLGIVTVVFIATIQSGDAVQCYVCNNAREYEGERCNTETLDKTLLMNCTEEGEKDDKTYIMCRKFVQDVEGDYRIVRTCATGGRPEDGCVARTGTSRIKLKYCECVGDECNAAQPSVISLASLILSILLVVLSIISLP